MKTKFKDTEIGLIPVDWEVEELQKIITKLGDGLHGTPKYEDEGNYYFINGNNLMEGKIQINETTKKCAKEEFEKYKKELNNRTIMISINGTLGNIALYNNEKVILGKSVCYFDVKEEFNLLYIKYVLKNNYFQNYIQFNATGTTIKNVSLKQMREFKFGIPKSLPEQTSIAKILSDLDSKIELLQKQNKTLEAIGQAIFKHWFVDFEFPDEEGKPYKSSGGEMVFNEELGKEIPKGWKSRRLEELFKFVKGKKPRRVSEQYTENYLPQILIETLDGKNPVFADPEKMILVDKKNPIMVMDGASSGRIEIGFIGILGSTLALLKINNSDFNNIVYYFLKTKEEDINKNTTGTSIPHTDKNKVYNYEVSLPENNNLANRFQKETSIIISKITLNKEKIRLLQKTRDLLLPKLMTGKIRVPVEVE